MSTNFTRNFQGSRKAEVNFVCLKLSNTAGSLMHNTQMVDSIDYIAAVMTDWLLKAFLSFSSLWPTKWHRGVSFLNMTCIGGWLLIIPKPSADMNIWSRKDTWSEWFPFILRSVLRWLASWLSCSSYQKTPCLECEGIRSRLYWEEHRWSLFPA